VAQLHFSPVDTLESPSPGVKQRATDECVYNCADVLVVFYVVFMDVIDDSSSDDTDCDDEGGGVLRRFAGLSFESRVTILQLWDDISATTWERSSSPREGYSHNEGEGGADSLSAVDSHANGDVGEYLPGPSSGTADVAAGAAALVNAKAARDEERLLARQQRRALRVYQQSALVRAAARKDANTAHTFSSAEVAATPNCQAHGRAAAVWKSAPMSSTTPQYDGSCAADNGVCRSG
jgi:hypothetical protein